MKPLLDVNYLLAGAVLLSLAVFSFGHRQISALHHSGKKVAFAHVWEKLITLWDDLVGIKKKLLKAVALSLLVQFFGVVIFWCLINPFIGGQMDFVQALAFIPLGLMTLALPVAPSGLGVGHAIFQKLFEYSGIVNGASLFNLYFVVTLCVNLLGAVPYVLSKRGED